MFKRYTTFVLVLALLVVSAAPAAMGRTGGVDRPFRAELVGEVTFAFFDVDCEGRTPVAVETQTESVGTATHMGKVTATWRHCPTTADSYENGRLSIVAANGDELIGQYTDDGYGSIVVEDFEGTGRFEGASGRIEVFYEVTQMFDDSGDMDFFVPWPWKATLEGTITY